MSIKTTGLKAGERALKQAMKGVVVDSERMMTVILAAISANTAPYIPVDTSTLINSESRSVRRSGGSQIIGEIGYGAGGGTGARGTPVSEYAVYVHEGPQKNWQKPGASNQYLAKGVRDFVANDLRGIIARYAK